jgi:hypothetical protein
MPSSPRTASGPVDDGDDVIWAGSAQNGWMPLVIVIVLGHAAVATVLLGTTPAAPYLNAAHLVVLAALELFGKVRVRVDTRELVIRYGYVGWLRQRIAVARIATARAFRLEPVEHGGWGYRGSVRFFGRAAVVVRAGDALALELEEGRRLSITVDGAETAAQRINALIGRPTASTEACPG